MDVSTKSGAKLIQWSSTGVFNQICEIEDADGGCYIKSALSNLYVTAKDGLITQEEKSDELDQIWVFEVKGEYEPIVDKMLDSEAAKSLGEYKLSRLAAFEFPVVKKLKRFVYTSCDTNSWNGGAGIIWNNMGYQADHYRTRSHYAHELGHVMDIQRHDIWYRAIALDLVPVSTYGNNTRWEDLADFCRMFLLYRGDDKKLAALERTYPARFLAMKGLMYEVDPVFYAEYIMQRVRRLQVNVSLAMLRKKA